MFVSFFGLRSFTLVHACEVPDASGVTVPWGLMGGVSYPMHGAIVIGVYPGRVGEFCVAVPWGLVVGVSCPMRRAIVICVCVGCVECRCAVGLVGGVFCWACLVSLSRGDWRGARGFGGV